VPIRPIAAAGTLRAGMFDGYQLPGGTTVADIGGADGTVLADLLAREPDRHGIVFDLPHVVPAALDVLRERGLAGRVETAYSLVEATLR
jgi:O-methyltransferase